VTEQGRFPDPGIAADQEGATSFLHAADELIDGLQLDVAAEYPDLDPHLPIFAPETPHVRTWGGTPRGPGRRRSEPTPAIRRLGRDRAVSSDRPPWSQPNGRDHRHAPPSQL